MTWKIVLDPEAETIGIEFDGDAEDAPELGPVTFVTSDPNIATVAAAADPHTNTITPTGSGTVTLSLNPLYEAGAAAEPVEAVELEVDASLPIGERVKLGSGGGTARVVKRSDDEGSASTTAVNESPTTAVNESPTTAVNESPTTATGEGAEVAPESGA